MDAGHIVLAITIVLLLALILWQHCNLVCTLRELQIIRDTGDRLPRWEEPAACKPPESTRSDWRMIRFIPAVVSDPDLEHCFCLNPQQIVSLTARRTASKSQFSILIDTVNHTQRMLLTVSSTTPLTREEVDQRVQQLCREIELAANGHQDVIRY